MKKCSRRRVVKTIGKAMVSLPFAGLMACSGGRPSTGSNGGSMWAGDGTGDGAGWAAGGTDKILVDFPDTSVFEESNVCAVQLMQPSIEGPCYYAVNEMEDISAGYTGLPMQLCFQVIDAECNPVPGVLVEVWHCDARGVYSADAGNSSDSARFNARACSNGDESALSNTWYRGEQSTDNDGRVNFKSCFPGWYPGRTVHIHFRIRNNGLDSLVSQLTFSDEISNDICGSHPEYVARGLQDTPLASDMFFAGGELHWLMEVSKNSDGSLLAYKRIAI